MSKRHSLQSTLLVSLLVLTACDKTPDADSSSAASPAAAPAASPADSTPAPSAASSAASPAATPASPASAAAPAATPAATPAASGASDASSGAGGNPIPPPKGMPAGPTPVEGTDYVLIDAPDNPTGDKVTVAEVFGYGCPHCNALAPHISQWVKKLPSDVDFSYEPAAFGNDPNHCWDDFARAFYAAKAMGILEKSHDAVYKEIWDQNRLKGCASIPALYADFGVDPKVFASTMQSFAVGAKIAQAHEQVVKWGVDSTPTIVVDGKYRVQELTAGGPDGMFHTVEWLIAKQRPEHAKH